jgi:hypothetical protein
MFVTPDEAAGSPDDRSRGLLLGRQRPIPAARSLRGAAVAVLGAVAVTVALVSGPFTAVRPAAASPVDPGPGDPQVDLPFCSGPAIAPGRAGWSRVVCATGARRFVVPAGVHALQVTVVGGSGGSGSGGTLGGRAQTISASIMVAPGQRLEMAVGGAGDSSERGGFNGGGDGPHPGVTSTASAGGGGGESDIRPGPYDEPATRILVAAGGGGAGGAPQGAVTGAGAGGLAGRTGGRAPGVGTGTGGGAATSAGDGAGGGSGATAGTAGSFDALIGGTGGAAATSAAGDGGGGGGGYGFGGGGAAGTAGSRTAASEVQSGGSGGGGGSSFVNAAFLQPGVPVTSALSRQRGDGSITIEYHAPPVVCGSTIYASTTLTTDLYCPTGTALTVGADADEAVSTGIVLDLGGHTIRGGSNATGIELDEAGIVIRNGTLSGFETGIDSHDLHATVGPGIPDAPTLLTHLTVSDGDVGLFVSGRATQSFMRVDVQQTVITGMTAAGLATEGDGSGLGVNAEVRITDSTLSNSEVGIDSDLSSLTLIRAHLTGNTGAGLVASSTEGQLTVIDTTVVGNGAGISVTTPGPSEDSGDQLIPSVLTLDGNDVTGNGTAGIVLNVNGTAAPGDLVLGNVASGNGVTGTGDGLDVTAGPSASGVTVADNTAVGNDGLGIDAPGVADRGGNTATGNTASTQCIGVVCTAP